MNAAEVAVIAGAAAAIAWVNWYFLGSRAAPVTAATPLGPMGASTGPSGIAQAVIEVDGGYSPSVVRVKVGQPVRLVFDRKDANPCSDEIVIPDFGVRRFLPTGERTTIEVTPPKAGRYAFTCGMSMLRGTIVAED